MAANTAQPDSLAHEIESKSQNNKNGGQVLSIDDAWLVQQLKQKIRAANQTVNLSQILLNKRNIPTIIMAIHDDLATHERLLHLSLVRSGLRANSAATLSKVLEINQKLQVRQ